MTTIVEVLKPLVFVLLALSSIFLILIVMVQRGKGGGLAGALGGMGGQSALGTKAGDLFTRITIGVVAVWIVLNMVAIKLYATGGGVLSEQMETGTPATPATSAAPVTTGPGPAIPVPAAPSTSTPEKPADAPSK